MGSLDKMAFKGFVDTECSRKLFLTLGLSDPRWIARAPKIVPRRFEHEQDGILDLGKVYEASVYQALGAQGNVRVDRSPRGEVVAVELHPATLMKRVAEVEGGIDRLCLIEHQFVVPDAFGRAVFGLASDDDLPLLESLTGMRPDLLLLERGGPVGGIELCPDGTTRPLPAGDTRVAVRIVDIKHTAEMRVGKSHFIELLYYARALSAYLETNGLRDRVYVPTAGHGILPQHDLTELFAMGVANIDDYIVSLEWTNVSHLFEFVQGKVRGLLRQAPLTIEEVPVNIQASCGHCRFVEDCKSRLGYRQGVPPSEWDVRLLPHTSDALCQQLNAEGYHTIGDVAERIADYQHSDTPEPLYAEKSLLALKAKSLVAGEPLEASAENTGGSRHLTMAIPKFSEIELVLDAEADPTNDVVFAVGFSLSSSVSTSSPFHEVHCRWWQAWEEQLQRHRKPKNIDVDAMIATLDPAYVEQAFAGPRRRDLELLVRMCAESLWALRAAPASVFVVGSREGSDRIGFAYRFGYVNGGAVLADERKLAEVLVQRAYHAVVISSALESVMGVVQEGTQGRTYVIGPRFAGFYWSVEQLQHLQGLLERHLDVLIHDDRLRAPLLQLLNWLTPSESEVDPSLQHKKLFNLRTFVETSVGLPHIINYTWHGLARQAFGAYVDPRFWATHFNHMDFAMWHAFVDERDTGERTLKYELIVDQLLLKVQSIHRLLWRHRKLSSNTISSSAKRPVSSLHVVQSAPPDTLHPLARVWYLFSRLNGTMAELGADHARLTFPAKTIGKLRGGEVSALTTTANNGFRFELRGLSSNMKIRERDHLYLLPERMRDLSGTQLARYMIVVKSLRWSASANAYVVVAAARREDSHPLHTGEVMEAQEQWLLYPTASDVWSFKLYGKDASLFGRHQMGTSWLGRRLSFLWGIGNDDGVQAPDDVPVGLPEVYLYAPELLPTVPFDPAAALLSDMHFPPDPSQRHAIHLALASTVCCLQGPPGTGKSQTIATLIDEFLHRRGGKPTRILVTAFSYAALNVVLDKVLESANEKGQPTRSAGTQAIFMRSGGRELVSAVKLGRARDLVVGNKQLTLDGDRLARRGGKRLEDYLEDSFILFGNAHQLYRLGELSGSKANEYELVGNGFAFDLIIVDEASQLPVDYFLTAAAMVHNQDLTLSTEPEPAWPARSHDALSGLACDPPLEPGELTKVVIVGDDHQLPPVQAVKAPRKLRLVLDSLFRYMADGHEVPRYQLRTNYRSEPTIVAYTRMLGIYEDLGAFRQDVPHPILPPVPESVVDRWLQRVLSPSLAVGTIIHGRRFETAVSPLEAKIVSRITTAFFDQMGISSPEEEYHFWQEHMGIVSPHNAHGRLVARRIFDALTMGDRRTQLSDEDLMRCLDSTIYSVEKFQGSDRTFILATMGLSSLDQLRAEEDFIYDLNRFNVLTSRARQKMLLVTSQNLLDYVPRDRESMANAARIRAFATEFCGREEPFVVEDEDDREMTLRLRWYDETPDAARGTDGATRPNPPPLRAVADVPKKTLEHTIAAAIASLKETPEPGLQRDEVIRIACQQLRLSPQDDHAVSVLGSHVDDILEASSP